MLNSWRARALHTDTNEPVVEDREGECERTARQENFSAITKRKVSIAITEDFMRFNRKFYFSILKQLLQIVINIYSWSVRNARILNAFHTFYKIAESNYSFHWTPGLHYGNAMSISTHWGKIHGSWVYLFALKSVYFGRPLLILWRAVGSTHSACRPLLSYRSVTLNGTDLNWPFGLLGRRDDDTSHTRWSICTKCPAFQKYKPTTNKAQ